jgi:hypothetical protein
MPNTSVIDLGLSKNFSIRERATIELQAQAFNLLNHQNVTGVSSLGYTITTSGTVTVNGAAVACSAAAPCLNYNGGASGFGSITNADSNFAYSPRQIQLGVRLKF